MMRLSKLGACVKWIGVPKLIENPRAIPGLKLVGHAWAENDGAVLVKRWDGTYTAYYQLVFERDPNNDAGKASEESRV